jgi:GNAT superfamily N-acetyltransferase
MRLTRTEPSIEPARDRASHAVWGGGLPVEEHVRREQALRATAWSQRARTGWSWVTADGAPLATCETYAQAARWQGRTCTVWAVASVFTAPEARRAGHASALMAALSERADLADAPLVLFSDIDPAFYRRLGYVAQPAIDRVWSVEAEASAFDALGADGPPTANPDALAIPSDGDQLDWHRLGAGWPHPPPSTGCRVGDSWLAWTPAEGALRILDAGFGRDARDCVAMAVAEARRLGLREIRAWETPGWPAQLGARRPRSGAIPMVRWPRGVTGDWREIPWGLWV